MCVILDQRIMIYTYPSFEIACNWEQGITKHVLQGGGGNATLGGRFLCDFTQYNPYMCIYYSLKLGGGGGGGGGVNRLPV